jgi:hypothetical protein
MLTPYLYTTSHTYVRVHLYVAAGRVVGKATSYELDDSGYEPRYGGNVFRTPSDGPRGPHNLLQNGYQGFFPAAKRRGVMLTNKVKGTVALRLHDMLQEELYLSFCLTFIICPHPTNKNVSSCSKKARICQKNSAHFPKIYYETNFRTLN